MNFLKLEFKIWRKPGPKLLPTHTTATRAPGARSTRVTRATSPHSAAHLAQSRRPLAVGVGTTHPWHSPNQHARYLPLPTGQSPPANPSNAPTHASHRDRHITARPWPTPPGQCSPAMRPDKRALSATSHVSQAGPSTPKSLPANPRSLAHACTPPRPTTTRSCLLRQCPAVSMLPSCR